MERENFVQERLEEKEDVFNKLLRQRDEIRRFKKDYFEKVISNFYVRKKISYKLKKLGHYALTLKEAKLQRKNNDISELKKAPLRFSCTAQALQSRIGQISSSEHNIWKKTKASLKKAKEMKEEIKDTFLFLDLCLVGDSKKLGQLEHSAVPLESIIFALPQIIEVIEFLIEYFPTEKLAYIYKNELDDDESIDMKDLKNEFYKKHEKLFFAILIYYSALFNSSNWDGSEQSSEVFLNINKLGIHPIQVFSTLNIIDFFKDNYFETLIEMKDVKFEKIKTVIDDINLNDSDFSSTFKIRSKNDLKKCSVNSLFKICLLKIPSDLRVLRNDESISEEIRGKIAIFKNLGHLYMYILSVKSELEKTDDFWRFVFGPAYSWAKYEMYRAITLQLAEDFSQFSTLRLIFSFLIVNKNQRFSNFAIRDKALEIIFTHQKKLGLWDMDTPIKLSNSKNFTITSFEAITPILEQAAHYDDLPLHNYLGKIQQFFEWAKLTLRKKIEGDNIAPHGWYPEGSRSKEPESWFSSTVLYFIKTYCITLSRELRKLALKSFDSKKIDELKTINWSCIMDSYSTKINLSKMFSERIKCNEELKIEEVIKTKRVFIFDENWSCIFFGPPGTGKTTLAESFTLTQQERTKYQSKKRDWYYIQLTPGEFFVKGAEGAVLMIRKYFTRLSQLTDAVIFFDEIEDLMQNRDTSEKEWDKRSQFSTTLLPKFQDLHNSKKVKFIIATNKIERVDSAISREGRIDFVIPVGHPFPYSRLNLLFQKISEDYQIEEFDNFDTKQYDALLNFIGTTCFMSYKELDQIISLSLKKATKGNNQIDLSEKITNIITIILENIDGLKFENNEYSREWGSINSKMVEFFFQLAILPSSNKNTTSSPLYNLTNTFEAGLCGIIQDNNDNKYKEKCKMITDAARPKLTLGDFCDYCSYTLSSENTRNEELLLNFFGPIKNDAKKIGILNEIFKLMIKAFVATRKIIFSIITLKQKLEEGEKCIAKQTFKQFAAKMISLEEAFEVLVALLKENQEDSNGKIDKKWRSLLIGFADDFEYIFDFLLTSFPDELKDVNVLLDKLKQRNILLDKHEIKDDFTKKLIFLIVMRNKIRNLYA